MDNRTSRGILGLQNLGNTCYMNATLQALRHNPEWTLFCTKDKIKDHIIDSEKPSSVIILLAYQDLIKSIWSGSGPGYVRPLDFYGKLKSVVKGTLYEDFIKKTPQDAHEFLVWLMDQMHMAMQKDVQITIRNQSTLEPMILKAATGWKNAFEKQYSPLTDLVFGLYRVQYLCTGCLTIHSRWETFNTLKIHPGHLSIEKALQHEFKEEDIEGYECDSCKQKTLAKKTVSIWRLPKLLIITLKRFMPMGPRDNSPFDYKGENMRFESTFSPESQEESKFKEYKVFATVDHHGSHMGGHYTSQCFNPVWKKWHMYDDETAHEISEPKFGVFTYILFVRSV